MAQEATWQHIKDVTRNGAEMPRRLEHAVAMGNVVEVERICAEAQRLLVELEKWCAECTDASKQQVMVRDMMLALLHARAQHAQATADAVDDSDDADDQETLQLFDV